MAQVKRALLVYDIFCQWYINFESRVNHSPYLSVPDGMEVLGGIGDFHVKGHVDDCFARFALVYIIGSGVIDGEILETLWAVPGVGAWDMYLMMFRPLTSISFRHPLRN